MKTLNLEPAEPIASDLPDGAAPVDHRTVVGRFRRAHTRARIVEAAAVVYAHKGPDTPVIDDFVKAAGMSRGTFYNHFTTTSELMDATVDWFEKRLTGAVVESIRHYPDLVAKAAIGMRLHLHWVTSDPVLCAFFARMPQVAEVGRRKARAQLRQGIAAGAFRVDDFETACDMIFGTLAETIRRIALAPERPKRCDEVVSALLGCLGVDRARVAEVMAIPLPDVPLPVRLADIPIALRAVAALEP